MAAAAMAAGIGLRQCAGSSGNSQAGPLGFVMHAQPKPVPGVAFTRGHGEPLSLDDLRGKVILLNIWATWCAPCKQEMPSLDRLQAQLGGPDFEVMALSIDKDSKGLVEVKAFYSQFGISHLRLFHDPTGTAGFTLGTVGLPTTLLLDRRGRELGRLTGKAEWDSEQALTFVRRTIAASPDGK